VNRVIEIIAGVAAVVFILAMTRADFGRDRSSLHDFVRLRYATAPIVLVCVIVLGVRNA
jgi:uncharacterized membrane protein YdjX (TVP38/TMEM64 family)